MFMSRLATCAVFSMNVQYVFFTEHVTVYSESYKLYSTDAASKVYQFVGNK